MKILQLVLGLLLGNFINIKYEEGVNGDFDTFVTTELSGIFLHEYGHTIDSRLWGPGYAIIALSSIGNEAFNKGDNSFWTEKRANRLTKRYMERYYQVDWDWFVENGHPM